MANELLEIRTPAVMYPPSSFPANFIFDEKVYKSSPPKVRLLSEHCLECDFSETCKKGGHLSMCTIRVFPPLETWRLYCGPLKFVE